MDPKDFFKRYQYDIRTDRIDGHGWTSVYKGYDRLTQRIVLIRIAPVTQDASPLHDEYEALRMLPRHQNVSNYEALYTFNTPQGVFDFAILPYLQDAPLAETLASDIDDAQRNQLATDLLEAIRFLHSHRLLHCDLNPNDIWVVRNNHSLIPKVVFGLGKGPELEALLYNSPEYLSGQNLRYNTDLWSYGAIVYEILNGEPLFDIEGMRTLDEVRESLILQMNENRFTPKLNHIESPWNEILKRCLIPDPALRTQNTQELFAILSATTILPSAIASLPPIVQTPPNEVPIPTKEATNVAEIEEPSASSEEMNFPASVNQIPENEKITDEKPDEKIESIPEEESISESESAEKKEASQETVAPENIETANEAPEADTPDNQITIEPPVEFEIIKSEATPENETAQESEERVEEEQATPISEEVVSTEQTLEPQETEKPASTKRSLMDLVHTQPSNNDAKPTSLRDLVDSTSSAPQKNSTPDAGEAGNATPKATAPITTEPAFSSPFMTENQDNKRKKRAIVIAVIALIIIGIIIGLSTCSKGEENASATSDGNNGINQRDNFIGTTSETSDENETPARTSPVGKDGQPCSELVDIEGNRYKTVLIGKQCWMKENLRTKTFADGTAVGTSMRSDVKNPAYYPQSRYGYLYNWYAVARKVNSDSTTTHHQGICPNGWHIPTKAEWEQLRNYVASQYAFSGNPDNIGKPLASQSGWDEDSENNSVGHNRNLNNVTNFSATPAGVFCQNYVDIGTFANFWSCTAEDDKTFVVQIGYNSPEAKLFSDFQDAGRSVRCLKD